jgi:general secretion pathway protein D
VQNLKNLRLLTLRRLFWAAGLACWLAGCATTGSDHTPADLLMEEGKWEEAVAAYQERLKDDPFNASLQAKLNIAKTRASAVYAERGRTLMKERKVGAALELFKQALLLEPTRAEYHALVADALRVKSAEDNLSAGLKLLKVGRLEEAAEALEQALQLDPSLTAAQEALIQVSEKQRAARAVPMAPGASRQPITLKFQNARTKEVFEVLSRSAGINFLFDKDLKDDPITVFVKDTTFEDALNLILRTQNLFMRRVAADTILIIPKTKQKLDQYQDLLIRTFYLSSGKAKDLVNLLRTMLESKRVYVNEDLNAIVIRDSPDKVKLAERIIYANDRKPGEVLFEIEVLEVDKTKSDRYGVNFAKQAGAAVVPPGVTTFPGPNLNTFTYQQLIDIGTGSYLFTIPSSILIDFLRTESDAKTLANPKVRVVNNKQAKINIGDKVPILLSTTNTIPGTLPGTIPTQSTITSIEFKDVGVKLSVEPTIHLNYQVTIKLQIEVTRLGDLVTLQDNPVIRQFRFGTRTAETTLTLRDGESVVLGGLIQDEDRTTVTKVPGLGDIPVVGHVFKSTARDMVRTDVILTITPRIIRGLEMPSMDEQAFWSGTEETYAVKPLFTETGFTDGSIFPVPSPTSGGAASVPTALGLTPSETSGATAARPSTLSVRPADGTVAVGQQANVDLLVSDAEGLVESTLTVTYDPKVLEFRQAQEGEFLKRDGIATMSVEANPVTGTIVVQMKRSDTNRGVSGSGTLATLAFSGRAPGVSLLGVQTPRLVNVERAVVPASGTQGVMRVR